MLITVKGGESDTQTYRLASNFFSGEINENRNKIVDENNWDEVEANRVYLESGQNSNNDRNHREVVLRWKIV